MKKTLVALGVIAASSAQAGVALYDNDGIKINLSGGVDVVYLKDLKKGSHFEQKIDDADFGIGASYAINDDLKVAGYLEYDGDKNNQKGMMGDVYIKLGSESLGSIKVGRICGVIDDVGIASDYQLGEKAFLLSEEGNKVICNDEMIRYDLDTDMFYTNLSYSQDKNENISSLGKSGRYLDGRVGVRVANFDVSVAYGDIKASAVTSKERLVAVETKFAGIPNANVSAAYYRMQGDLSSAEKVKRDNYYLAGDYTLNSWKFGAGVNKFVTKNADEKNFRAWHVNTGYNFAKNSTAYVEVAGNNKDDNQTGIAVGVKTSF
ncbi:hypothetical protein O1U_0757 [Candidatus Photodesmus katoptron Akat1]|uniref:Porin domain-containing protein n=2 Tax=Candidatus Photodesmus anomalopis TaxID=28176 RepID=S3DJY0_9GAMM|nr:hypothetical protein O1U_0757 [Candidatus Photodesmus katoptron Akat1]